MSVTYPNGVVTAYTYYNDNRLHTSGNSKNGIGISSYNYSYGSNDNLTVKLDSSGTTTYMYDSLNRFESVTEPKGMVTEYEFDAAGTARLKR